MREGGSNSSEYQLGTGCWRWRASCCSVCSVHVAQGGFVGGVSHSPSGAHPVGMGGGVCGHDGGFASPPASSFASVGHGMRCPLQQPMGNQRGGSSASVGFGSSSFRILLLPGPPPSGSASFQIRLLPDPPSSGSASFRVRLLPDPLVTALRPLPPPLSSAQLLALGLAGEGGACNPRLIRAVAGVW